MKSKLRRYNWLAAMIKEKKFSNGVEVGAATGITTEYLLKNCPSLQLTVIDLWERIPGAGPTWDRDDMEVIFRNKFQNEPRLTIYKGLSWNVPTEIKDKSLDFVFIDASHDYESVLKDIKVWWPKVKKGGILCGHDLHFPGVQQATKELFGFLCKQAGIDNVWFVEI